MRERQDRIYSCFNICAAYEKTTMFDFGWKRKKVTPLDIMKMHISNPKDVGESLDLLYRTFLPDLTSLTQKKLAVDLSVNECITRIESSEFGRTHSGELTRFKELMENLPDEENARFRSIKQQLDGIVKRLRREFIRQNG